MSISTVFPVPGFPHIPYGSLNYGKPHVCHNPVVLKKGEEFITLSCNQWNCPDCAPGKKRELEKKIKRACEGRFLRHLTLTVRDDENLMQMWNNLKTQLRKRGKLIEYVWVKEFQKRGVRHLHILIFEFIPKKLIKRYWDGLIDIGFVRGSKNYLTKYLSKVEDQALFNDYEKRYSTSRDLFVSDRCSIPNPGYKFFRLSSETFIECTVEHFKEYYAQKQVFYDIVNGLSF